MPYKSALQRCGGPASPRTTKSRPEAQGSENISSATYRKIAAVLHSCVICTGEALHAESEGFPDRIPNAHAPEKVQTDESAVFRRLRVEEVYRVEQAAIVRHVALHRLPRELAESGIYVVARVGVWVPGSVCDASGCGTVVERSRSVSRMDRDVASGAQKRYTERAPGSNLVRWLLGILTMDVRPIFGTQRGDGPRAAAWSCGKRPSTAAPR